MAVVGDFFRLSSVKISFTTVMLTELFALAFAICTDLKSSDAQQIGNNQLANYQQMLAQQQLLNQNPSLSAQPMGGPTGMFPGQNLGGQLPMSPQQLASQQIPLQQPYGNQVSPQQQLANQQLTAQMLAAQQQNPQIAASNAAMAQQFPNQLQMPSSNLGNVQMPMMSEQNGILSPNELLALQAQQPRVCTSAMLMQIQTICVRDLQALGIVNISPSASISGALTWDILRRRSRANFQQICS